MMLGIHRAKERTWQRVASSHAIEQPRRADLRAHPRTEISHQQSKSNDAEKRRPRSRGGIDICRVGVWERLGRRPNELRDVDFCRRQKPDDHASHHRGQQNISFGMLRFFRKRRDGVEADVRQHRQRSASKQIVEGKCLRIIKRPREKSRIAVRVPKNVANGGHKDEHHHRAHSRGQPGVDARRSFDALQIQQCEHDRKKNLPAPDGNSGRKFVRLSRAPNGADQWIHDVIHDHAPTGDVPGRRMNLLRHISESGARARVDGRHLAVAERRAQHRHHGDQDRRNYVPVSAIAQRSKRRHWRNRLQHNRAVQNQIPQRERPPQPWSCTCAGFFVHAILLLGAKSLKCFGPVA